MFYISIYVHATCAISISVASASSVLSSISVDTEGQVRVAEGPVAASMDTVERVRVAEGRAHAWAKATKQNTGQINMTTEQQ